LKGVANRVSQIWPTGMNAPTHIPCLLIAIQIFYQLPSHNQQRRRENIQTRMNGLSVDEERLVQERFLELESRMISDLSAWVGRELTIMETIRAIAAP